MKNKIAAALATAGALGVISFGVAYAQTATETPTPTTNPSITATPTPTTRTTTPNSAPSTGYGTYPSR
jgi:hypothetical protein